MSSKETTKAERDCIHMTPRESLLRIGLGYAQNDTTQPPAVAFVVCTKCDFEAWFWSDGDVQTIRRLERDLAAAQAERDEAWRQCHAARNDLMQASIITESVSPTCSTPASIPNLPIAYGSEMGGHLGKVALTKHHYNGFGRECWDIQHPSADGSEIHVVATAYSEAEADAIILALTRDSRSHDDKRNNRHKPKRG